jgi:hypothetical protein
MPIFTGKKVIWVMQDTGIAWQTERGLIIVLKRSGKSYTKI